LPAIKATEPLRLLFFPSLLEGTAVAKFLGEMHVPSTAIKMITFHAGVTSYVTRPIKRFKQPPRVHIRHFQPASPFNVIFELSLLFSLSLASYASASYVFRAKLSARKAIIQLLIIDSRRAHVSRDMMRNRKQQEAQHALLLSRSRAWYPSRPYFVFSLANPPRERADVTRCSRKVRASRFTATVVRLYLDK